MTNTETTPIWFTAAPLPVETITALDALFDAVFTMARCDALADSPVMDAAQTALGSLGAALFGDDLFHWVSCQRGDGAPDTWHAVYQLWADDEITPSPAVRAQLSARVED